MDTFTFNKPPQRRWKRFVLIIALPFLLLLLSYGVYKVFFIPSPEIEGIEAFSILPAKKTVELTGRNIKSISILIQQANKAIELLSDEPLKQEVVYRLEIMPKKLGLLDGQARVFIKAKSGLIKKVEYSIETTIDTVAPTIEVIQAPTVLKQGAAGRALFRSRGADRVYIKMNDYRFTAFPLKGQADEDGAVTYAALFPVPHDLKPGTVYFAVAEDQAGNRTMRTLSTRIRTSKFRRSSISIGDDFIKRVVYPLLNTDQELDPVKAFKIINEQWRERDSERIFSIGQDTAGEPLWRGRFLQLKNSKVMAIYGDRRTYLYKGKVISNSVHLGYDLASTAHAPVEAANSGIVKFAGDLGIYGNTVIIDHGLGLMSLYGHLSDITVNKGDQVKKGDIIGRTGATGFAGGDHLHFGILVHGIEVSPLYWWDRGWIKQHISLK